MSYPAFSLIDCQWAYNLLPAPTQGQLNGARAAAISIPRIRGVLVVEPKAGDKRTSDQIPRDEKLRMKLDALAETRTQRVARQILPRLRAGSPLDPEEVEDIENNDFYWIRCSDVTAFATHAITGLEQRYDLLRTPSAASPLTGRSSAPIEAAPAQAVTTSTPNRIALTSYGVTMSRSMRERFQCVRKRCKQMFPT